MLGNVLVPLRSQDHLGQQRSTDYDGCRSPRLTERRIHVINTQVTNRSFIKRGVCRPQRETGQKVRVNVSGKVFETYDKTLKSKPGSIFRIEGISKMYDSTRKEYYFDRNPKVFGSILVYLQCGVCQKPDAVTYKVFIEELQYFGFGELALKIFNEKCVVYQKKRVRASDTGTVKDYVWNVLEHPKMDFLSKSITLLSSTIILLSTLSIIAQSVPAVKTSTFAEEIMHNIQLTCLAWFTLETGARFMSCSEKKGFLKNPVNILDLLSVLPDVISLLIAYTQGTSHSGKNIFFGSALRILRVTRLIPAYGSDKFVRMFNTIMITISSSAKELGCFVSILVFTITLFACLLYSTENASSVSFNEDFSSVPKNVWFCVVTITSVGYGDTIPNSTVGRLVTSVMFGATILILTLPIPIVIGNFLRAHDMLRKDCSLETFYYDHDKSNEVRRSLVYLPNEKKEHDLDKPIKDEGRGVGSIL